MCTNCTSWLLRPQVGSKKKQKDEHRTVKSIVMFHISKVRETIQKSAKKNYGYCLGYDLMLRKIFLEK